MVMLRLGDSIVNENALIEIKVALRAHDDRAKYEFKAYWHDGEEVCSVVVHDFEVSIEEEKQVVRDKIDVEFRVVFNKIKWKEYATG